MTMAIAAETRIRSTPVRISAEEIERRRDIIRRVDHENLLEGQRRHPETDHIFEAFINGEIEVSEMMPRLKQYLANQTR
ncbi:hypothetical protein QA648_34955 (plasmid) [Rhizobium sp. CB3171]|uniref:hypothetical protein n=1 Tax=Rhizobium sp. CB3171 TaxID=3039157 RepID=UPI0024B0FAB1|nr:hypothetical protein [Rhizobium sp. CB3171]WFU07272.1 hypothetical protein QA648_34955 [Rhizobium sp. CB3171]